MLCQFCNKEISNASNLKQHQATRRCLSKQRELKCSQSNTVCLCGHRSLSENALITHKSSCVEALQKRIQMLEMEINDLKNEMKLNDMKHSLEKIEAETKAALYKDFYDKTPRSFITGGKNVKKADVDLNKLATMKRTPQQLSDILRQKLTPDIVASGVEAVVDFYVKTLFTNEEGMLMYGCVNISRMKFVYYMPNGNKVKDNKGKLLIDLDSMLTQTVSTMINDYSLKPETRDRVGAFFKDLTDDFFYCRQIMKNVARKINIAQS